MAGFNHNLKSSKREVSLPSPPLQRGPAEKLRSALRTALQDALIGAGSLGLLACGATGIPDLVTGDKGEVETGGNDAGGCSGGPGGTGGNVNSGGVGGSGGMVKTLPTEGFVPRTCGGVHGNETWRPLPGLTPSASVNSMTFHDSGFISQLGTPCAGATEEAECESKFEQINSYNSGCTPGGCQPRLIVTKGNDVWQVSTVEKMREFLMPIETADEAAMLVRMSGALIGCSVERGGVRTLALGGFQVRATRLRPDCMHNSLLMQVDADGSVTEVDASIPPPNPRCSVGRLPSGLCQEELPVGQRRGSLAAFLADAARLEAASVPAFVILSRDLAHLGAPERLVSWALSAAEDEIAHAQTTQSLAEAHGGPTECEVQVRVTAPASAFALAMENAVEGCVRETFGAAVAAYQAEAAEDPAIAAVLSRIARDEAGHAALAHELDAWLHNQLSSQEQAAVLRAKQEAIVAFRRALNEDAYEEDVHTAGGFPRAAVALRLHDTLFSQLAA